MHRDIKLDNILLNEYGHIKICDFGVSRRIIRGEKLKERCGTPAYIAPEIIQGIPYDGTKADIWSAGVVLYAMIYGNFPFRADNVEELETLIITGKFPVQDDISDSANLLITKILTKDPQLRPTIIEILSDPWMKTVNEECKI